MSCPQFVYSPAKGSCCYEVYGKLRCDWLSHFFDEYWKLFVENPSSREDREVLIYLYTHIVAALADEKYFNDLVASPKKEQLVKLMDLVRSESSTIEECYINWIEHLVEEYKLCLD